MKTFLIVLSFMVSTTALASTWKDRLFCYGKTFGNSKFVVELKSSIDNDGLEREVYFAKNINSKMSLVTNRCSRSGDILTCKNNDISIEVDVGNRYSNGGLWDAAKYIYHPTKVTKRGFFSDTTEEIRCHL